MKKVLLLLTTLSLVTACSHHRGNENDPYAGREEAMVTLPAGERVQVVYNGINRQPSNEKFFLGTRKRASTIWATAPFWILYDTVGFGALTGLKINPKELSEEPLENVHKLYTYPTLQCKISQSTQIDPRFVTTIYMEPKPIVLTYKSMGEDDYELTYGFDVQAAPLIKKPFQCLKTKSGNTLDTWQKDNYKAVIEVSHKLADECIQEAIVYLSQ